MRKTAIQQVIEFCEQNVSVQSEQMGLEYKTLDYNKVIAKLTELKEVEKQNIIDAFKGGFYTGCDQPLFDKLPTNYYNETFKD